MWGTNRVVGRASCLGASIDKLKNVCIRRYEHPAAFPLLISPWCDNSTITGPWETSVLWDINFSVSYKALLYRLSVLQKNRMNTKRSFPWWKPHCLRRRLSVSIYLSGWKRPSSFIFTWSLWVRCKNILMPSNVLPYKVCHVECFWEAGRIALQNMQECSRLTGRIIRLLVVPAVRRVPDFVGFMCRTRK